MRTYGRFYGIVNGMHIEGTREEFKCQMVSEWTNGRTTSLREMTDEEYEAMCKALESSATRKRESPLKKARHDALKAISAAGVCTKYWDVVNRFCQRTQIAGKDFKELTIDELKALARKAYAIKQKRDNESK